MLLQAFFSAQERQAQELAALELQRTHNETNHHTSETGDKQDEDKHDEKMVENIFGFLPASTEKQEEPRQNSTQVTSLEQGNT